MMRNDGDNIVVSMLMLLLLLLLTTSARTATTKNDTVPTNITPSLGLVAAFPIHTRLLSQRQRRYPSPPPSSSSSSSISVRSPSTSTTIKLKGTILTTTSTKAVKEKLLESLDILDGINDSTRERTRLVDELTMFNPTPKPGSVESFETVAIGTWTVIYAPHISFGSKVLTMSTSMTRRGTNNVNNINDYDDDDDDGSQRRNGKKGNGNGAFGPIMYVMRRNQQMTSHAFYDIPFLHLRGWLSVSGTYDSEDNDKVCRVDFDRAWVKPLSYGSNGKNRDVDDHEGPYECFEDVPDSLSKTIIQAIGQLGFVKSVSVFPVSYLDDDIIVFDFELLGTRICARKIRR